MKERVVTSVRISHHRITGMPRLMRLPVSRSMGNSLPEPIDAARGILKAFAVSGMLWMALIAAIKM